MTAFRYAYLVLFYCIFQGNYISHHLDWKLITVGIFQETIVCHPATILSGADLIVMPMELNRFQIQGEKKRHMIWFEEIDVEHRESNIVFLSHELTNNCTTVQHTALFWEIADKATTDIVVFVSEHVNQLKVIKITTAVK